MIKYETELKKIIFIDSAESHYVEIPLNFNLTNLSGTNNIGKTSKLNFLAFALCGYCEFTKINKKLGSSNNGYTKNGSYKHYFPSACSTVIVEVSGLDNDFCILICRSNDDDSSLTYCFVPKKYKEIAHWFVTDKGTTKIRNEEIRKKTKEYKGVISKKESEIYEIMYEQKSHGSTYNVASIMSSSSSLLKKIISSSLSKKIDENVTKEILVEVLKNSERSNRLPDSVEIEEKMERIRLELENFKIFDEKVKKEYVFQDVIEDKENRTKLGEVLKSLSNTLAQSYCQIKNTDDLKKHNENKKENEEIKLDEDKENKIKKESLLINMKEKRDINEKNEKDNYENKKEENIRTYNNNKENECNSNEKDIKHLNKEYEINIKNLEREKDSNLKHINDMHIEKLKSNENYNTIKESIELKEQEIKDIKSESKNASKETEIKYINIKNKIEQKKSKKENTILMLYTQEDNKLKNTKELDENNIINAFNYEHKTVKKDADLLTKTLTEYNSNKKLSIESINILEEVIPKNEEELKALIEKLDNSIEDATKLINGENPTVDEKLLNKYKKEQKNQNKELNELNNELKNIRNPLILNKEDHRCYSAINMALNYNYDKKTFIENKSKFEKIYNHLSIEDNNVSFVNYSFGTIEQLEEQRSENIVIDLISNLELDINETNDKYNKENEKVKERKKAIKEKKEQEQLLKQKITKESQCINNVRKWNIEFESKVDKESERLNELNSLLSDLESSKETRINEINIVCGKKTKEMLLQKEIMENKTNKYFNSKNNYLENIHKRKQEKILSNSKNNINKLKEDITTLSDDKMSIEEKNNHILNKEIEKENNVFNENKIKIESELKKSLNEGNNIHVDNLTLLKTSLDKILLNEKEINKANLIIINNEYNENVKKEEDSLTSLNKNIILRKKTINDIKCKIKKIDVNHTTSMKIKEKINKMISNLNMSTKEKIERSALNKTAEKKYLEIFPYNEKELMQKSHKIKEIIDIDRKIISGFYKLKEVNLISADMGRELNQTGESVNIYLTNEKIELALKPAKDFYENKTKYEEEIRKELSMKLEEIKDNFSLIKNMIIDVEDLQKDINNYLKTIKLSNVEKVSLSVMVSEKAIKFRNTIDHIHTTDKDNGGYLSYEKVFENLKSSVETFISDKNEFSYDDIIGNIKNEINSSGTGSDNGSNGTSIIFSLILISYLFDKIGVKGFKNKMPVMLDEIGVIDENNIAQVVNQAEKMGLTIIGTTPSLDETKIGSIKSTQNVFDVDLSEFQMTLDPDDIKYSFKKETESLFAKSQVFFATEGRYYGDNAEDFYNESIMRG